MTRREMLIQDGARKSYTGSSTEAVCARVGYAKGYDEGYHQAVKDTLAWFDRHITSWIGHNTVIGLLPTHTDVINNYLDHVEVDPMLVCAKED